MLTSMWRLARAELKLIVRDPLALAFVFVFPVVTMLIVGGSFGTKPQSGFEHRNPSQWYVASYLSVVIGAMGLVVLPVHLASYRERGVLRRFAAAGFPRWSFALALVVTNLVALVAAGAIELGVAAPVYGIPALHDLGRVALAAGLGAIAFVGLGVVLGTLLPSARAAQAVGLILFFPSFLLGGGGPPPAAMGATMHSIAALLPLSAVTTAIRDPWLGLGAGTDSLLAVAALAAAAIVLAGRRAAL